MQQRIVVKSLAHLVLFWIAACAQLSFAQDATIPADPVTPRPPQGVAYENDDIGLSKVVYITLVAVSCVVGIVGLIAAGVCWYRHTSLLVASQRVLYRSSDSSVLIHNGYGQIADDRKGESNGVQTLKGLAKRTDYPAYGVTGPNPLHEESYGPPIDKNLSKNAEMFHYNQTKKRMKAMSSANSESSSSSRTQDPLDVAAELEMNDEETSDGEYTVYECSGFASAMDGPMEIHNPLFDETAEKNATNGAVLYPTNGVNLKTNSMYEATKRPSEQ